MSDFEPTSRVHARVHGIDLMSDNCFRLILELEDDSFLHLQWPPDSPEFDALLAYLSELASARLAALGEYGISITGPTEDEEDEE